MEDIAEEELLPFVEGDVNFDDIEVTVKGRHIALVIIFTHVHAHAHHVDI
jgi:hypothetical protein